jgi:hypothetical protein
VFSCTAALGGGNVEVGGLGSAAGMLGLLPPNVLLGRDAPSIMKNSGDDSMGVAVRKAMWLVLSC